MRGVAKGFQAGVRGCSGTVTVLRGVDLEVRGGELVAVLGAPGAGKSTLLLCAAGLLRVDRGVVAWFGEAPARDATARPAGIAYAGDRPFPYGFLTVREALDYAGIVRDLSLRGEAHRVDAVLDRVGLAPYADRRVDSLDPSRSARLSLAMALLGEPRLLLVDELPPACDPATAAELAAVLRATASGGAAVVAAGEVLAWHIVGAQSADAGVRDGFAASTRRSLASECRVVALREGRLSPVADPGAWRAGAQRIPAARVAEVADPGSALRHRGR